MLKTLPASHCLERFFPRSATGAAMWKELFRELRGTGGGDPLGGHINSPDERRECVAKPVVVGMEKNEQIPKIFRAQMRCS